MKKRFAVCFLSIGILLTGCSEERETAIEEEQEISVGMTDRASSEMAIKATEDVEKAIIGLENYQGAGVPGVKTLEVAGTGSGVIYKKEEKFSYAVTNQHVISGAEEIQVTFANGKKVSAEIIGQDVFSDLAVVKFPSENVENIAVFGDSESVQKGETVLAIGNPLGLGFFGSVTKGVLSGKDRVVPIDINKDGIEDWRVNVMQTDAAINPGNSGGALVDLDGKVIGINSMKIAQDQVEGIGLVIPSNIAVPIIEQLEKDGKVQRPYIGISLVDLTVVPDSFKEEVLIIDRNNNNGVAIMEVADDQKALEQYDVIYEVDDKEINSIFDLRDVLFNRKVGDEITISILRKGVQEKVKLLLEGK